MFDEANSDFAKFLKRHRKVLVTAGSILTIGGSLASIIALVITLPTVGWASGVLGMSVILWVVFGTVILYNKLNKLSTRIDNTRRAPEPGEYVYIEGEDDAMEALTAATKRARKSVCSTRFFPCPIQGRHDTYAASIRGRVLGDDGHNPLRVYYRIVAANKPSKLEDVKRYIREFSGKPFKLFLTHKSNSFELVIIDDQETFIHFYGRDSVIGSTLYLPGVNAAKRFRDVFDRLRNRSFDETIEIFDCENIREEEIEKQIKRAKDFFDSYVPPHHQDHYDIEEILNPRVASETKESGEQAGAGQPATQSRQAKD
jgi:hypothetical protein